MNNWLNHIKETYNIDIRIFLLILYGSIIPFWISSFQIIKNLKKKKYKRSFTWFIINIFIYLSPYIYLYIVGKKFPLWMHIFFWVLITVLVIMIIRKIKSGVEGRDITEKYFWNLRVKFYDFGLQIPLYQELIDNIIEKIEIQKELVILDAGCGTGEIEKRINEKKTSSIKVEAIDFAEMMLKLAEKKCKNCNNIHINFLRVDLNEKLYYQNSFFDRIISNNVLYTLKNQQETLNEFYRVLKSGGKIVLVNPKQDFKQGLFLKECLNKIHGFRKIKFILIFIPLSFIMILPFELIISWKVKRNQYYFPSANQLVALFKNAGFDHIKINDVYANQGYIIEAKKL